MVHQYLDAVQSAEVNVVELGFRTLKISGYQGACAFTTDEFIRSLTIPPDLLIGVMVNGNELLGKLSQQEALQRLFPASAGESLVELTHIACHVHEFEQVLSAVRWLKERGYLMGLNLMQAADRTEEEVKVLACKGKTYPLDVLYLADSMGSMNPEKVGKVVRWIRSEWNGVMGIHTHDNMGIALSNTLRAVDEGIMWVDSTVTGMGREPGNSRTEELAIFDGGLLGSPDTKDMILARESALGNSSQSALFLDDSHYDYKASRATGFDFVLINAWSEWQPDEEWMCPKGIYSVRFLKD